jgi:hypothetical protein
MEKKKSLNESHFNASARLAQRLYSKYSDTGQIIPNVSKNMKRYRGKLVPKVKLPNINKVENKEEQQFPPLHYPKGFEQYTAGMDAKAKERAHGKMPVGMSRLEITLNDSPDKSKNLFRTMAPSPNNEKTLMKHPLMPPSRLLFNEKTKYATIGSMNPDGIKSVSLLKNVSLYFNSQNILNPVFGCTI